MFERVSFALVEQIFQGLLQEPETRLVTFSNQVMGPDSVPDGRVRASFSYWIETKIASNAVRKAQIQAHVSALDADESVDAQRLLILTPDYRQPAVLRDFAHDERIVWASFQDLVTAVEESLDQGEEWLTSDRPLATERERDLLRELVQFIVSEGLTGPATPQVLVVAARRALPDYHELSAYVCQPNRTFQRTSHMAFYANGRIDRHVPKILERIEAVTLTAEDIQQRTDLTEDVREQLVPLAQKLHETGNSAYGKMSKVLLLTSPDDPETVILDKEVENDLESDTGRTIAFTQGQRYVAQADLFASPAYTSELL